MKMIAFMCSISDTIGPNILYIFAQLMKILTKEITSGQSVLFYIANTDKQYNLNCDMYQCFYTKYQYSWYTACPIKLVDYSITVAFFSDICYPALRKLFWPNDHKSI